MKASQSILSHLKASQWMFVKKETKLLGTWYLKYLDLHLEEV